MFTSALVEGLDTGDADRDQDGYVGLDELYDYVFERVRQSTPHQTPGKWTFDLQGDLHIARRGLPVTVPAPLPQELQEAIEHPLSGMRAGAVGELARLLSSRHGGLALAARLCLQRLADDDSRTVAAAAVAVLSTAGLSAITGTQRHTTDVEERQDAAPTPKPSEAATSVPEQQDRSSELRETSAGRRTISPPMTTSPRQRGSQAGSLPADPAASSKKGLRHRLGGLSTVVSALPEIVVRSIAAMSAALLAVGFASAPTQRVQERMLLGQADVATIWLWSLVVGAVVLAGAARTSRARHVAQGVTFGLTGGLLGQLVFTIYIDNEIAVWLAAVGALLALLTVALGVLPGLTRRQIIVTTVCAFTGVAVVAVTVLAPQKGIADDRSTLLWSAVSVLSALAVFNTVQQWRGRRLQLAIALGTAATALLVTDALWWVATAEDLLTSSVHVTMLLVTLVMAGLVRENGSITVLTARLSLVLAALLHMRFLALQGGSILSTEVTKAP